MSLKEEKWKVSKELINTLIKDLDNEEKLTYEMLMELRDKINEMIKNDF
jgi:hypothetical protein